MKKQTKCWNAVSMFVALCMICVFAEAIKSARASAASSSAGDVGATFNSKCAKCHGHDGRGKTFRGKHIHARDLTEANWQNDVSDERLFNSISNGRNKMPAFKKQLSESDIDALVLYVRRLKK